MNSMMFEETPRWPGAPPVCLYENLPAFASIDDTKLYQDANCPGVKIGETWQCGRCGIWHFTATDYPPSGSSSGNQRPSKAPVPRYKKGSKV